MAVNYKTDFLTITQNQDVRSDCADITFFNQGAATVILNNTLSIPALSSISFTANAGEIDRTIYNVRFQGSGIANLIVFRKIYIQ